MASVDFARQRYLDGYDRQCEQTCSSLPNRMRVYEQTLTAFGQVQAILIAHLLVRIAG